MWRRRVLQVAIPYGLGGWVLVQVAEVILDAFEAPPWVMQGLLVVLVLGFPVAVILAWVFDITPEHKVVRTAAVDEEAEEEEEPEARAMAVEMGESERRQVTILNAVFDVDFGEDPEDDPEQLRELVALLKSVYEDVESRFEAYQLPGAAEELTLVFGYPQAREDDARRAVSAGLELIEKTREIGTTDPEAGRVFARVGVSTSLVIVEDGADASGTVTFIGQAPRMAGWLCGLAAPATVLIGPYTRKLVNTYFDLELTGTHEQTQFGDTLETFRVGSPVSPDQAFGEEVSLQGRDDEFHRLLDCWENVIDGGGQFVMLRGDPGIGKSSLMNAFVGEVHRSEQAALVPCQCSPQERDTPLAPVIRALRRYVLKLDGQESASENIEKLEQFVQRQELGNEQATSLLASLLSLDAGTQHPAPTGSAQSIRVQTLELLLDLVSQRAERNPLLLVIEDLHWADPSTLEMIQMMVDRGPAPGLFVLFTARPVFKEDWTRRTFVQVLELAPLSRRSARRLIESVGDGKELPEPLVKRIIEETDGNPLFIQELTLAVLESDAWRDSAASGDLEALGSLEIPATLKDSLTARLDNLGEARSVLQLCSVLGQEFSYELLRSVSGSENEDALKQNLAEIVGAELLYQRGVLKNLTYTFKHILILETAYNSLLKTKRRELHARTADILEKEGGDAVKREPALLAYHYSEAGQADKAIPYWTRASRQSLDAFANQEAITQARRGVKLIDSLPETPARPAAELPLRSVLGMALLSTHGYVDPQVRKEFTRAQDLCEKIGDAPQLFQVVVGLWMYYIIASELDEAFEQAQRLLRIAETTDNPAHQLQARYCQAFVLYYQGEFLTAQAHLEAAMNAEVADCDYAAQSASGDDTRLHVRVLLALINWHLGFSKTAARLVKEANAIARQAGHPWGRTFAAFYSAWFQQMRRDSKQTLSYAQEAAAIAEEKGFRFWLPLVAYMRAWAGNRDASDPSVPLRVEAVDGMKEALGLYRGVGAGAGVTYLCFRLAEDYIALGLHEQAHEHLASGWAALQSTGEDFCEPEYYRLNGQIAFAEYRQSNDSQALERADDFYRKALTRAQRIESKGLELRAANDRARVLEASGRHGDAAGLLEGILQRFAELDGSEDIEKAKSIIKNAKKAGKKA